LHRGGFENRGHENTEVIGGRLEFQSRDFPRVIASGRGGSRNRAAWPEVGQGVPDA
jgi:hypothetical protein